MQEFFSRMFSPVGQFFAQLTEKIHIAIQNADPGQTASAVVDVVLPFVCAAMRILAIVIAILILARCVTSLFREKGEKAVWGSLTLPNGTRFELNHWENTVGRARRSDVVLDFPTVSRSHLALLRDDKGNWMIHPLQTKNGTRLNRRRLESPVPIQSGDTIALGGLELKFYAVGEQEEREQAMERGVAERRLSPAKTLAHVTVFQILMCLQCMPGRSAAEIAMIGVSFATLLAAMWGLYALYRAMKRTAFEVESLAFFLCTISFGVTAAYSPASLLKQTVCMLLGLVVFMGLSVLLRDLRSTVSLRWPVAVLTCALLVFNVLLGQRLFGARNWISLGPISFQPSEFVKVAFLFTGAATLDRLFARRNLIFTVLFCGFCMGCLALMSDFGTALIFFVALLVIAFLRSGDVGFLAMMATAAGAGCWLILRFKPYIANRFAVWHHVWEFSSTTGYQQTRTMSAIASGGLFGKGTEHAFLKTLGAANTDLAFGVVSEEFGLILAICTVLVLLALVAFSVKCAGTARSSYYVIASSSAAAMLVFQAALNIFGSVDILPLTGVTLPFVSVGGSSMISCWGLLAFLKAADTRPNASFTLKLPKRIRGWIPYDYYDGYDDEDYDYDDSYGDEDENYGGEGNYDDEPTGRYQRVSDRYEPDEPTRLISPPRTDRFSETRPVSDRRLPHLSDEVWPEEGWPDVPSAPGDRRSPKRRDDG